jgi:hypothetical protein
MSRRFKVESCRLKGWVGWRRIRFWNYFFLGKRMAVDSERWMVIRFWNYFFSGKRMVTGLVFGIIFFRAYECWAVSDCRLRIENLGWVRFSFYFFSGKRMPGGFRLQIED